MKYEQRYDGEEFILKRKDKIACCDCGLVHKVEARVGKGKIFLRTVRDERATAAKRRGGKYKK